MSVTSHELDNFLAETVSDLKQRCFSIGTNAHFIIEVLEDPAAAQLTDEDRRFLVQLARFIIGDFKGIFERANAVQDYAAKLRIPGPDQTNLESPE